MLKDKYKLFIFDLDGTLIDSERDILNSVNFVRSNRSLSPLDILTVRSYIGNGANVLVKKIFPDASPGELEKAFQEFKKHYYDNPVVNTTIYSGVGNILEKLKEKRLAVLTNKPEKIAKKVLELLGLSKYFSIIWGGDTGPQKKPDPSPINAILDKLKIKPEETVLIGDGINDIKAAKAAGVKVVGLGYGYSDHRELFDLKPDYFVNTSQELLELI